jgi:polysaccharide export outer membrane protein
MATLRFLLLALFLALPAALPAQTGQTQQPSGQAPAPRGGAQPYKPDFVIPKPDGPTQPTEPTSQIAPGDRYVVGPQDNLSISVTDETDLSGKYRVDTDGTLTFPYLGRVPVAGLTLEDLQSRLTSLLKAGYIKNPQVRVEVDQYKSRSVYVIGEVRTPGKVTMAGTTLTLLEALALAGSPTANASNEVIVVHPSKRVAGTPPGDLEGERVTVNRKDLELGKTGQDIVLLDGDIINVPVAQRFYISGFVRNPGYYVLDPGMTIDQAIALAGGLSDRGSNRRISAKRQINGKVAEVSVNLEDKVQANDTINIPSRFF